MTDELAPGLTSTQQFTVEGHLLTDVGGSLPQSVLSTPGMIGMMEWASAVAVQPHLPDGGFTVGFHVDVKHLSGAVEGASCTATATLTEVDEGRKFRFAVEVREGDRLIGTGTHERRMPKAFVQAS
jgi:fluoroacetyl-CoA thioesterase